MVPYEKTDVSESKLEDMVRQYPFLIEEGMRYIDHQNQTLGGRLDVLLVDSGNALVVAELKVTQDDGMLVQCLDYYDFVSGNIETFARLYKNSHIDVKQPVRLLLVAPSFSSTLLNRCRWLDIPISVYSYQCIKVSGHDQTLPVFRDLQVPSRPKLVELTSLNDHVNYITDEGMRAILTTLLAEVKDWDPAQIAVDAIKSTLSLKVCGRVFAYLTTRRKHFIVSTYDQDGDWGDHPVKSEDDLVLTKSMMRIAMERLRL